MMRYLLFIVLVSGAFAVQAQTYGNTYAGNAYPRPQYSLVRNYPLSAYRANESDPLCLTCNHCQLPSATFNPSFPLVLMNFRAERRSPGEVKLWWNWISDQSPSKVELLFLKPEGENFELVQGWKDGFPEDFFHKNSYPKPTWYQLKVTEADGTAHLSKVREVRGMEGLEGIIPYPNPGRGKAFLKHFGLKNGLYRLRLLDLSGRTLVDNEVEIAQGQNLEIPGVEGLGSGVYLVELRGIQGIFREKLIRK